jgi:YHS domain-containing protein
MIALRGEVGRGQDPRQKNGRACQVSNLFLRWELRGRDLQEIPSPVRITSRGGAQMIGRVALLTALAVVLVITGCDKKEEKTEIEHEHHQGSEMHSETEHLDRESGDQKSTMKARDPVCGMFVERAGAIEAVFEKETYYFCNEECHRKFLADPHGYLEGTHVYDPVCGMKVEYGGGPDIKHEGSRYHFCSKQCKAEFEKAPEKYVNDKK